MFPNVKDEWVEVEEEVPHTTAYQAVAPPPPNATPLLQRLGNGALYAAAAFFGITFLVSILRYSKNYNKVENKSRRRVIKNQDVVRTLSELLPSQRSEVTRPMLRKLQSNTGFSATEVFRKYLWYVLRERRFDQDAMDDLLHLKAQLQLSNDEVAEALRERCVRIEKKYGNLMLQIEGLSERGLQRKATCRALFSKMLYLVENEAMLQPCSTMSVDVVRDIFGATEDDIAKLRIVSLQEVDLDTLDTMIRVMDDK